MQKTITLGTDAFLMAGKSLLDQGKITKEQYLDMERNNNNLPKETRKTTVELR